MRDYFCTGTGTQRGVETRKFHLRPICRGGLEVWCMWSPPPPSTIVAPGAWVPAWNTTPTAQERIERYRKVSFSCEKCKHKLICLVQPESFITYEAAS